MKFCEKIIDVFVRFFHKYTECVRMLLLILGSARMLFYRYESNRPITIRYYPSAGYTRVCELYREIYNFIRESNLRSEYQSTNR